VYGGRTFEVANSGNGARLYTGASDDRPTEQKEMPRATGRLPIAAAHRSPDKPDLTKLCVKGGFNPALAYTLAFTAKNPKVFGIGLAATRDLVAFLRYDPKQRQSGGRQGALGDRPRRIAVGPTICAA